MKILFTLLLIIVFSSNELISQTITEKELFKLKYRGPADAYSLVLDNATGSYCYVYTMEGENKTFIISENSVSEKYDYCSSSDIRFDSKGNYYAVTSNYKPDYGIDNYFLIANGKEVFNSNSIESYNAYINESNEFVFIFKENEKFKIGYYSIENGLRKSDAYDNIRTVFNYNYGSYSQEGDAEVYNEEDFFHNEKGERAFICLSGGKAKIVFETSEISTDYSDINESSLTLNKKNELSYFAKKEGQFYQDFGNEVVVSGNKEYNKFQQLIVPLLFNRSNEPVYSAADSLGNYQYDYYLVIGNEKQNAYTNEARSTQAPGFSYGLLNLKINSAGDPEYIGMTEVIIPATKKNPDDGVLDHQYYTAYYFVGNGYADELGYNIGPVKYSNPGDMLYSGIADPNKKEFLLMMNYGVSKVIISKPGYDEINNYGFTPKNEIYYIGQNYEKPETGKKSESSVFIGDKLIGKYQYVSYQTIGDSTSILKFNSYNNYAFVAEEKIDSFTYSSFIVNRDGRMNFPNSIVPGGKMFSFITSLMYSKNDKLFFIGNVITSKSDTVFKYEAFVNNASLEKIYSSVTEIRYNPVSDQVSFIGARGNKVYHVIVQF